MTAPRMTLTCRECGHETVLKASVVRDRMRNGRYRDAAIDFEAGTGSGLCRQCTTGNNGRKSFDHLVVRHGRNRDRAVAALRVQGVTPLTDEQRARGRVAAAIANTGRPKTEEHKRALSIA